MVSQPDEIVAKQGFSVRHDALHGAAGGLPGQVAALGSARQVLMARHVPADAFARVVPASPQARAGHSRIVGEINERLAAAAGRLGGIIGAIQETSGATGEFDSAKGQQLAQLTQGGSSGTITWPDGRTTNMQPGGTYYAPKYRNPGDAVTTYRPENFLRMQRQPDGDDLLILRDGTWIYFTDSDKPIRSQ